MLPFCGPEDDYSIPWVDSGFSRCFLQTVGSMASAGILILLGLTIIVLGPKGKEAKDSKLRGRKKMWLFPKLFIFEAILCVVLSLTYVTDLVVKGALHLAGEQIYGYTIVEDALGIIAWLFTILMLYRERIRILQGKHHGISLALFWILNIVWFSLQLVSFSSSHWWWHLNSRGDISDLVLFVVRSALLAVIVVLGILRPLCCPPRSRDYTLLVNADTADLAEEDVDTEERNKENRERKEGSFIRKRTTSAFSDFWMKAKLLFPYVWPKGTACIVGNLGGRGNIFVFLILCIKILHV